MGDTSEFVSALISSWIKRWIYSEAKWVNLFLNKTILQINITELLKIRSNLILNLIKKTPNLFLKEVLLSWTKVINLRNNINKINKYMDIRVLLVKFMGKPNLNKSIGAFQLILQIMNDIYLYISTLYTIKSTRPATVRHFECRMQPI